MLSGGRLPAGPPSAQNVKQITPRKGARARRAVADDGRGPAASSQPFSPSSQSLLRPCAPFFPPCARACRAGPAAPPRRRARRAPVRREKPPSSSAVEAPRVAARAPRGVGLDGHLFVGLALLLRDDARSVVAPASAGRAAAAPCSDRSRPSRPAPQPAAPTPKRARRRGAASRPSRQRVRGAAASAFRSRTSSRRAARTSSGFGPCPVLMCRSSVVPEKSLSLSRLPLTAFMHAPNSRRGGRACRPSHPAS